jgi:hypothetical protein
MKGTGCRGYRRQMIAKLLEDLINHLLALAGVPSQLSEGHPSATEGTQPEDEPEGSLQPVPVKSFLHYL